MLDIWLMKMTGYIALTLFVIVMATLPDKSQLLKLEDVPNYQTARVDQEVNPETLSTLPSKKSIGKLDESALKRKFYSFYEGKNRFKI